MVPVTHFRGIRKKPSRTPGLAEGPGSGHTPSMRRYILIARTADLDLIDDLARREQVFMPGLDKIRLWRPDRPLPEGYVTVSVLGDELTEGEEEASSEDAA